MSTQAQCPVWSVTIYCHCPFGHGDIHAVTHGPVTSEGAARTLAEEYTKQHPGSWWAIQSHLGWRPGMILIVAPKTTS